MKGRSVKLREAHKSSSTSGSSSSSSLCSVIWDGEGNHLITSSSSDTSVLIHDVLHLNQTSKSYTPKALRHHKDGVTCLALSPDSTCLASGSIDHSVKLHGFPDGEFQSNVTRFTLPIRSLAFNKSGSLLAAAGDDDGIKLIATIDSSISQVLKGHKGPVTGLSFDPNNEFLASIDGIGTVIYWELSSGKPSHTLKAVAPDCGSDTSISNVLSWSPDGETLAVPGLRNDVVMYDRDTAEKLFSLKGEHERAVCFMTWSPNGKYMATSSLDMQILIWDIDQRQDIERQKFEERISYMAWKPNGNALAVIDSTGRFGVWDCPVPACIKSPTDGAPSLEARNTCGVLFDEDDQEPSASGSLDNSGENSYGESAPINRKRLRKQCLPDDDHLDDDSDGQDGLLREIELRKRRSKRGEGIGGGKEGVSSLRIGKHKMQEAFQPCSTPAQCGKRHFLCYNMLGSITTVENEGYSHIEVDFHDTGRGSRVPSMTDYFGFTMASLSETGSVFANPGKGEKKTSTLMYRPFSSWANNSEWSMRFEAEEVKVVALGTGWVAAITDHSFLRIFTDGGLQKYVLSLSGPVVSAAGFKDELAVVTHASDCLSTGDQMLEVKVFNISTAALSISCRLPLTPGSCLSWFGFSEEGQPSAYDSKGVLRVLTNQFGGSWLPLFSADRVRQTEEENYWVVGLNTSKLFCIVCKSPESYPLVTPVPVLTLLNLSFPLVSSDLGAGDFENELIMSNLHLSEVQKKIEQLAAAGIDTSTLDDEAFDIEAARDRCILRLIASCCNGDKLVRATELAKLLSLEKSVKGAIKLVTALKLPTLAERFNGILEERILSERPSAAHVPNLGSNATTRADIGLLGVSRSSEKNISSEPTTPLPPSRLLTPQFSKQDKVEEKSKSGEQKAQPCKNSRKIEEKGEKETFKNSSNCISKEVIKQKRHKIDEKGEKESLENSSNGNSKEVINLQPHRPLNPFAKTSNNQEKSSLFDSLKKMKKTDDKKVGNNKTLRV